MTASAVKLTRNGELQFTWSDGRVSLFPLTFLRDSCPCAVCKGESDILGNVRMPAETPRDSPGKYELKSAEPVGNYALALRWGDGHDTGIYSWQYLRSLEDG
jgi:DUF971 family protein